MRATNREDIVFSLYHLWIFGVSFTAVSHEDTYSLPVSHWVTSRSSRSLPLICALLTAAPYFILNQPQDFGFDLGIALHHWLRISYHANFQLPGRLQAHRCQWVVQRLRYSRRFLFQVASHRGGVESEDAGVTLWTDAPPDSYMRYQHRCIRCLHWPLMAFVQGKLNEYSPPHGSNRYTDIRPTFL